MITPTENRCGDCTVCCEVMGYTGDWKFADRYNEADFEVTNQIVKEVISLPMHTELGEDQIDHITNTIHEFLDKK